MRNKRNQTHDFRRITTIAQHTYGLIKLKGYGRGLNHAIRC